MIFGRDSGLLSPGDDKYSGNPQKKYHQVYESIQRRFPVPSAAMKFLVAALVVLALAIGSESVSLVRREAPELDKLTQYFKDLSESISRTTQEMVEKIKGHELTGHAQGALESGKTQLQPIADKIQEHLQQLKPLTESMQAQMKPLAESLQAQLQTMWQQVMDQVKALPAPASQ